MYPARELWLDRRMDTVRQRNRLDETTACFLRVMLFIMPARQTKVLYSLTGRTSVQPS